MLLRELAYHRFQCPNRACGTYGTVAYFADVTEIRCPRCQEIAVQVIHQMHEEEEEDHGRQESRRTQPD